MQISKLCWGLDMQHVDPIEITKKVVNGVYNVRAFCLGSGESDAFAEKEKIQT